MLPGVVPQPLFFIFIVSGCIIIYYFIDKQLRLSSIFKQLRLSSFSKKNVGRLPFSNKLRSCPYFQKIWGRLQFKQNLGCLPFSKLLSSSSMGLRLNSWVEIRLHTENQFPRLSKTVLTILGPSVVVWWWYDMVFLPIIKIILDCWLGFGNKTSWAE